MPRQESIEQNDDRHDVDQYPADEQYEMRERYNSSQPSAASRPATGQDNYTTPTPGSRSGYSGSNMGGASRGGGGQGEMTGRLADEDEEDGDWC